MLIHRRRCHRPRLRRYAHDATAPLVAALEQIIISEPEMAAGSSSSIVVMVSLYSLNVFILLLFMQ